MKKLLTCAFFLAIGNCYAGTGFASDGYLFVLSILMVMLLFLGTGYFIDFLKARRRDARRKRFFKQHIKDHDTELISSDDTEHSKDFDLPQSYIVT